MRQFGSPFFRVVPRQPAFDVNNAAVQSANLYDHPKYYDVVFGNDWRREFRFLEECFREFVDRRCRQLLEPACGTGRLLNRFAKAGYSCHGIDLNEHAVRYCNRRLERHELSSTAIVGDMADFSLADFGRNRAFDAAFNTINSFRHLDSEEAAVAHLQCVAQAVRPGGIYVLGFHLTPPGVPLCQEETWSAKRGQLQVSTTMVTKHIDRRRRRELVDMFVDVETPTGSHQFQEEMVFRTYSAKQLRALLAAVPELEQVATFDFAYDLESHYDIDQSTEDVVLILQRR